MADHPIPEAHKRQVNELSSSRLDFQLLTEDDWPLDPDLLDAITVLLHDKASGAVINSRDRVDILNVNGGAIIPDLSIVTVERSVHPVVETDTDHFLRRGDSIQFLSMGTMSALDNRAFKVDEVLSPTTITVEGLNTTRLPDYISGGLLRAAKVLWEMEPADNPILGAVELYGLEPHIALVEWGYDDGGGGLREAKQPVQIDVKNLDKVPAP